MAAAKMTGKWVACHLDNQFGPRICLYVHTFFDTENAVIEYLTGQKLTQSGADCFMSENGRVFVRNLSHHFTEFRQACCMTANEAFYCT